MNLNDVPGKVFYYFEEYCMNNNIADMKKESQNVFRACLKYIQMNVFSDNRMLRSIEIEDNIITPTKRNEYNYKTLLYIYEIYENISLMNNKEISYIDYSMFTGVKYSKMKNWTNKYNKGELSGELKTLIENLHTMKEASIEGSGKADLITMAKLNHYFDWNVQGIKSTNDDTKAISVNELRERLGLDVKE